MKKLYISLLLTILTFQLHAEGEEENDFCTAEEPCEEERVDPCIYCPSYYYFYEEEDLDIDASWPGRRYDEFMDSLIR